MQPALAAPVGQTIECMSLVLPCRPIFFIQLVVCTYDTLLFLFPMRLSSSLLKSCIATMAFPSYGYMAEENKALSGLGCAVLVCRLLSRTLVYFSLAPHFFVLITPPPSMWKTAAMATAAVPEPEGKTHGRSRSRFMDVFHSPGCSLRSSRHSKVEKKKKRHAPDSISFHIPSSCDVEEPRRSAKKVKRFHSEGWDGIFFF